LPLTIIVPVGLYLLVALLSVFLSCDTQLSFRAFLGKILQSVLLFFVLIGTLSTRRRIYIFLMWFLASAVILSLDGFWQIFAGWDIFKHNTLVQERVCASMRHPNDLGAYLIIVLPLMLMIAVQSWNRWRTKQDLLNGLAVVGSLACSGAAFTILALTYSRSAWLGFLVGIGLWALVRRSYKIFIFFVFVIIFVLTPLAVSKRDLPQSDLPFLRGGTAQEVTVSSADKGICGRFLNSLDRGLNSSDRLHYWEAAVRIIKDHPLTGIGLNTYTKVIREYAPRYPNYAHNCYLQVAAELGLPGLAVMLWALLAPLVFALRRFRTLTDPRWSDILGAVSAGYIALLAESALDTTFYSVQLFALLWVMMALLVAIPRASEAG